jgi:hypothetical protein
MKMVKIDELVPEESSSRVVPTLEDIFSEISRDRMAAARKVVAYVKSTPVPESFINAARRLIFLKGRDSHDYKFSSAVLEDFYHLSPACRGRFLAASVFNLKGSGGADNELVQRTRAALA